MNKSVQGKTQRTANKDLVSLSKSSNNAATSGHILTMEQIKSLKDENAQLQRQVQQQQRELQEKTLRVRVVEDALAFRSEEIGLAGHADLLAKIAQLKSEVRALKSELMDKSEKITNIEEDKHKISTEHETLQQQIANIQQRLAQSQQEAYKYASSDLGVLLKSAEHERDVLLEYIQQDMEKCATFAKQVEHLEAELRSLKRKEHTLMENNSTLDFATHELRAQVAELEKENESLRQSKRQLEQSLDSAEQDKVNLHKQIDRKTAEENEFMQHQVTIFAQLRAKDEELLKKTEEIISLRGKLQEWETLGPPLRDETLTLRAKLKESEALCAQQGKQLLALEGETQSLTSTVEQLSNDNRTLKHAEYDLVQELQTLRPYKLLFDDLEADLQREDNENASQQPQDALAKDSDDHNHNSFAEEKRHHSPTTSLQHHHGVKFASPIASSYHSTSASKISNVKYETSMGDDDDDLLMTLSPSPPRTATSLFQGHRSHMNSTSSSPNALRSAAKKSTDAELIDALTSSARSMHQQAHTTPAKNSANKQYSPPKAVVDAIPSQSSDVLHHMTASQRHALWIGLPSLRRLHPRLYEHIRRLAHDLYVLETRHRDLQASHSALQAEFQQELQVSHARHDFLTQRSQQEQAQLVQMHGTLRGLEEEVARAREAQQGLAQWRRALRVFGEQYQQWQRDHLEQQQQQIQDNAADGHTELASPLKSELWHVSLQRLFFSSSSFSPSASTSSALDSQQSFRGTESQSVQSLEDATQTICQAFLQCTQRLAETQALLSQRQATLSSLETHCQRLQQEVHLTTQRMQQQDVHQRHQQTTQQETQQQLILATDLAEKQNALVASLEAKVETLQRDKTLKAAQLTALQQREETLRHRLIQLCQHQLPTYLSQGAHGSNSSLLSSASLTEVVQWLLDHLATTSLVPTSGHLSSHTTPKAHHPRSGSLPQPSRSPQSTSHSHPTSHSHGHQSGHPTAAGDHVASHSTLPITTRLQSVLGLDHPSIPSAAPQVHGSVSTISGAQGRYASAGATVSASSSSGLAGYQHSTTSSAPISQHHPHAHHPIQSSQVQLQSTAQRELRSYTSHHAPASTNSAPGAFTGAAMGSEAATTSLNRANPPSVMASSSLSTSGQRSGHSSSAAALALQERIRGAQQSFRAQRDASSSSASTFR